MQTVGLKGFRCYLLQTRLWYYQRETQVYRAYCRILIKGELDIPIFQSAFQQVINQYDILRTQFYNVPGMQIPMQVVRQESRACCPFINLEGLNSTEQDAQIDQHCNVEPFNLENEPLIRALLLKTS